MGGSCSRSLSFHTRSFLFALIVRLFISLLRDLIPRKRNKTWNQLNILVLSTIQYHSQSELTPCWAFIVRLPLLSFTINYRVLVLGETVHRSTPLADQNVLARATGKYDPTCQQQMEFFLVNIMAK